MALPAATAMATPPARIMASAAATMTSTNVPAKPPSATILIPASHRFVGGGDGGGGCHCATLDERPFIVIVSVYTSPGRKGGPTVGADHTRRSAFILPAGQKDAQRSIWHGPWISSPRHDRHSFPRLLSRPGPQGTSPNSFFPICVERPGRPFEPLSKRVVMRDRTAHGAPPTVRRPRMIEPGSDGFATAPKPIESSRNRALAEHKKFPTLAPQENPFHQIPRLCLPPPPPIRIIGITSGFWKPQEQHDPVALRASAG